MFENEKYNHLLELDHGPKLGATSDEVDKATKNDIFINVQLMRTSVLQPEGVAVMSMAESATGGITAIVRADRERCECSPYANSRS